MSDHGSGNRGPLRGRHGQIGGSQARTRRHYIVKQDQGSLTASISPYPVLAGGIPLPFSAPESLLGPP